MAPPVRPAVRRCADPVGHDAPQRSARKAPTVRAVPPVGPTGVGARDRDHARRGWAGMTDLLHPRDTRLPRRAPTGTPASSSGGAPPLRPLALGAAVAGVAASGAVLMGCMALGL